MASSNRLCGIVPPEVVRAFCDSDEAAAQMIALARKYGNK
jgi:hypothetical protein